MDYISVSQAAGKWGISERRVQKLLGDGRVLGALHFGHSWMIPADAQKPADPRREKPPEKSPFSDLDHVVAAVCIPVPRDNPDSVLENAAEERLRWIFEGALAYARGDFERAIRCFRQNEGDDAAKLLSCQIAIASAISTGDYQLYIEIEAWLKDIVSANINAGVTALAEMALSTAYLGAMAPLMVPDWLKEGDVTALPPEARPQAVYMRVKYFQCLKKYEAMLAAAQTALALYDSEQEISFLGTYLRLMCAVALYSLERIDEASHYLLDAMRINLPHGFITPFAELMPLCEGHMEQCLKKEFPAHYDTVFGLWKRVFPNWIAFHNYFTKDNITSILSLRDYEIVLLAARGVPYAKIAKQYSLSVGRLNNIMREIYEKLFISRKKELAKFIL